MSPRLLVPLILAFALPAAAQQGQTPALPAGWAAEGDSAVHAQSGHRCRAVIAGFNLAALGYENNTATCGYVAACQATTCAAETALVTLSLAPSNPNPVAQMRRTAPQSGQRVTSPPLFGAAEAAMTEIEQGGVTGAAGIWAKPQGRSLQTVEVLYTTGLKTQVEAFISAVFAPPAPAPAAPQTAAAAANANLPAPTVNCPERVGVLTLTSRRTAPAGAPASRSAITAGVNNADPLILNAATIACIYGGTGGGASLVLAASANKGEAQNRHRLRGEGEQTRTPVAPGAGVLAFGRASGATTRVNELYLAGGSAVVSVTYDHPRDTAVITDAVRAALAANP